MLNEEKIELTSIEQTAYWWTNRLMYKARDFASKYEDEWKSHLVTPDEAKFLSIFYHYTDKEWRDLYLKLTDFIKEQVKNFESSSDIIAFDTFNQDTAEGQHELLNAELSKITGVKEFPDIRLADSCYPNERIFTNMSDSSVSYNSYKPRPLKSFYEPTYILTGNEQELNLYNSLISTLSCLDKQKHHDLNLFRQSFCKAYKEQNAPTEDIVKVIDLFNKCYHTASKREIIWGRFWHKKFFLNMLKYDLNGLSNDCINNGKYYSSCYTTNLECPEKRIAEDDKLSAPTTTDEVVMGE